MRVALAALARVRGPAGRQLQVAARVTAAAACSAPNWVCAPSAGAGLLARARAVWPSAVAPQTAPRARVLSAPSLTLRGGAGLAHSGVRAEEEQRHGNERSRSAWGLPALAAAVIMGSAPSECEERHTPVRAAPPSAVRATSAADKQECDAPVYLRFAATLIDIVIGRVINVVFTLALKLGSMRLGRPLHDDVCKIMGNLAQVIYFLTMLRDDELTGANGQTLGKKLVRIRTVLEGRHGPMSLQVSSGPHVSSNATAAHLHSTRAYTCMYTEGWHPHISRGILTREGHGSTGSQTTC